MTTAPIYTAESLIQHALYDAVAPVLTAYSTRVYWRIAPSGTARPYLIIQPQSDMLSRPLIGKARISTVITLKGVADTLAGAHGILNAAAPALDSITAPSGYSLSIVYRSSPVLPYDGSAYQSAHTFNVVLART